MKNDLEAKLKSVFGFDSFRSPQKQVVEAALAGRHTLVLMPTGLGKSLCFQLPAKILPGTVLVISPLIALMKDQVDQAKKLGFKATFINSSLSRDEKLKRYKELSEKKYEIVYVAPERFAKSDFLAALKGVSISLLAIDEAHCISQWGHDFRPDYTRIAEFRRTLGNPPTMAVTATATPHVQKDIMRQMGLTEPEVEVFRTGIERPNLNFEVMDLYGMDSKIRGFVALRHQFTGACIVYFSLISTLIAFSKQIEKLGFRYSLYHGDMRPHQRSAQQERFLSGESDLILATNAFGLGINKKDIRLIVHGEIPSSLESYYQEAGRAGRDGEPAHCALLYDLDDVTIQEDFIKWSNPDPSFIETVLRLIKANSMRWRAEGFDFLREQMNFKNSRDFRVETAVNLLKRHGLLVVEDDSINDEKGLGPTEEQANEAEVFDQKFFERRITSGRERLLHMVQYATQTTCRKQTIYTYFGDNSEPCGHCDNCTSREKT